MIHVAHFRTEAETHDYLLRMPDGDSAPVSVTIDGARADGVMLVRRSAGVERVPFGAGHADFRNGASSDGAMMQSARAARTFAELARASGYTMRPLAQGSSGTFVTGRRHFLFSGSAKVPGKQDYFDLTIFSGTSVACYSKRHGVGGITHSGDLYADGRALLMHTLCANATATTRLVVSGVGYNLAELVTFEHLLPHISMVNDEAETILVAPFTLDRASIGDSTLLSPLVLEITPIDAERIRVRYTVPAAPVCFSGVTTGSQGCDCPPALKAIFRAVEADFESDFARLATAERAPAGHAAPVAVGAERTSLEAAIEATSATVFVQDGLAPPPARWNADLVLCRVGTTLRVSVPQTAPGTSPPSVAYTTALAGSASGPQSGLKLYGPSESPVSARAWLAHVTTRPSVLYMSIDGVRESEVATADYRFNGVLVVVGPRVSSELAARSAELCAVSAPCTRLMAACGVVLYFDGDAHYMYRGAGSARFYGLRPCAFAEPVEFSVDALEAGAPFAFAVPQACRAVFFMGKMTTVEAIVERMRVASVERLAALRTELVFAYEQIGVAFDATETRDLKRRMLAIAHENIAALLAPFAEQRRALLVSAFGGGCAKRELGELRCAEREARREVEFIVADLEALVSVRVASSKNALDVQGSARKSQIAARVLEASELSDAEYADLVCTVPFFVVAETRDIAALLGAASSAPAMEGWLVEFGAGRAVPVRRAQWGGPLDSETIAAVLDAPSVPGALESTVASIVFAMRGVVDGEEVTRSFLPMPVFAEALAWQGEYVDWMQETGKRTCQLLRMKLRGFFARLRAFPIGEGSHELTLALLSLSLSLAEGLEGDAPEDTSQQMLRGLVYLSFTVAASGKEPESYVFQLAQPHAKLETPRTPGHWHIYARALAALLKLAVPESARRVFRLNACRLISVAFRRGYVDRITARLRDGTRVADAAAKRSSMVERDERVQWVRACFLLFRASRREVSTDPAFYELPAPIDARATAAFLLAHAPHGAKPVRRALAALLDSDSASRAPGPVGYFAGYYLRYSGCFRHAKQLVLDGGAIGALDARRAEVAAFLGVAVTVPNYAAFAEGDRAKMLGDAELERAKWVRGADDWCCGRAAGYEPLSIDAAATFTGLLARAVGGGVPAHARAADADPVATEIVAARAPSVTIASVTTRASLPLEPIARICHLLGVDDAAAREMLALYLTNWRDVNAADAIAASFLMDL